MSGLYMKYFVLKPRSKHPKDHFAYASREAMKRFAQMIRLEEPELHRGLLDWVKEEEDRIKDLE